ncbi:ABC transporter [Arsukibacterium ikkense]|uniref:ABC transporter n=1 Tax=Arsukibacterium ikkense TaxID=336831 RepID=A0A0M2V7N7_9GAMM|nr:ABC transporter ATP-binding protein [Arsukibacterium ikkense]KKO45163.1 ABC transporter [Arsukibacterium ikkense]
MTTQPIIKVSQLAKSYGRNKVLNKISFEVNKGETVALIGQNGAGKTTLFSLLCGYIKADSGSMQLLGQQPGSAALFGKVSALPQDAQLDPAFSIGQQLSFYGQLQGLSAQLARTETLRVLALVDLEQHYHTKAGALSHGMRKRACMAQAFIGSPALILLDEPTAGLDPANALHIRELISDLSQHASFLISSHNIFELERLCNKVLYLQDGKLQQHHAHAANSEACLSLQLSAAANSAEVCQQLQQLAGITDVTAGRNHEYQLSYQPQAADDFDIRLLQCLAANGWQYKQLTKGKSLEQQLFAQKKAAHV